jgi:hypothetical protein
MPHPTAPADHAAHDPLLVAAYAAGDATGAQLDAAAALVATCADCAALHHDLRAIARSLPATAAMAPTPRPRDFRLTAEQADSLRPSGWRRVLAPFAGPSFAFARPLGTGLATIGLAGILVAGASGIPLGGAASAPAGTAGGGEAVAQEKAPVPADADASAMPAEMPAAEQASGDPGVAMPMAVTAPTTEPGVVAGAVPGGAASSQAAGAYGTTEGGEGTLEGTNAAATDEATSEGQPVARAATPEQDTSNGSSVSPVVVVGTASLVALLAGLALLGLRFAGRRAQRPA